MQSLPKARELSVQILSDSGADVNKVVRRLWSNHREVEADYYRRTSTHGSAVLAGNLSQCLTDLTSDAEVEDLLGKHRLRGLDPHRRVGDHLPLDVFAH
jgi:hypothetical protein